MLSLVKFDATSGQPVDPPTSNTSATTIFANSNNTACPDACFRPTGLAFDKQGRLFMASDASGEIYVVTQGAANESAPSTPTGTTTGPTQSASPTTGSSVGNRIGVEGRGMVVAGVVACVLAWV